jgi:hypothetical protein
MSYVARRELLAQVAGRYQLARPSQKTRILDEFVASTGYARKYALSLLAQPPPGPPEPLRRPRARRYGPAVQEALARAWLAANGICGKRLVPFLPELVASLERHGHLTLTAETRTALLALSPATADRLLLPLRRPDGARGRSLTRSGPLLKYQVPLRTFADWDDVQPGFVEVDLVGHGGGSAAGVFLCTLVLTDVATGWTECLPLLHKGQDTVLEALVRARELLPFPLLGLDTDNGTEFLNERLLAYCRTEAITFTRGRPHRKNDQCFVEQKNGVIVRQLVGYARYVGPETWVQLGELYRAVRLYVNFFQPSMKLVAKQRDGAKVQRHYDVARTPAQRLAATEALAPAARAWLTHLQAALDPVGLREQVLGLQETLQQRAVTAARGDRGWLTPAGAPSAPPQRFARAAAGLPEPGPGTSFLGEWVTERAPRLPQRCRPAAAPAVVRLYRTHPDAFAAVTPELRGWLAAAPDRPVASLLRELQARYPGQFADRQARTLERRVKAWRAELLQETAPPGGRETPVAPEEPRKRPVTLPGRRS